MRYFWNLVPQYVPVKRDYKLVLYVYKPARFEYIYTDILKVKTAIVEHCDSKFSCLNLIFLQVNQ